MIKDAYETVKVERENGIAWITLNRPEKRNAMTPQLHYEMVEILDALEFDPETKVLVLTGAGESWSAGQDLKAFFRDLENNPEERARAHAANQAWRWDKLNAYRKPTIAMVNGHCFGGAFTQLVACDFAIAAEEATFGLSEVNWGTLPGGFVCKAVTEVLSLRDAVWFACTGEPFDGKTAERIRLVNRAVPRARLREETVALAERLMRINPEALRATKQAIKAVRSMSMDMVPDYLNAKGAELRFLDQGGRERGLAQFLDEKSFRPGFGPAQAAAAGQTNKADVKSEQTRPNNRQEENKMAAENALVLIDLINDMVSADGKLAKRGYHDFVARNNVDKSLATLLKAARSKGWLIVHVRVGFSKSYAEMPSNSPLFSSAKQFQALGQGTPGNDFNAIAKPEDGEVTISKNRVSPFFGTNLELTLRANGIKNVYLAGVSTDLAVQSAARDAHDRDFNVFVVADCSVAGTEEEHNAALGTLKKISKVVNSGDI